MSWSEFSTLISGLNSETPLGRIVSIRSEKDQKVIKEFSPEAKRIRKEWEKKQIKNMTEEEIERQMEMLRLAFIGMAASQ